MFVRVAFDRVCRCSLRCKRRGCPTPLARFVGARAQGKQKKAKTGAGRLPSSNLLPSFHYKTHDTNRMIKKDEALTAGEEKGEKTRQGRPRAACLLARPPPPNPPNPIPLPGVFYFFLVLFSSSRFPPAGGCALAVVVVLRPPPRAAPPPAAALVVCRPGCAPLPLWSPPRPIPFPLPLLPLPALPPPVGRKTAGRGSGKRVKGGRVGAPSGTWRVHV